jgi:alginate O-acetyltransferase complex protein AlgI
VLFNSYEFLFLFLPAALLLHSLAERIGERARIVTIIAVSFIFYAAWDIRFLALLTTSILVNYSIGRALELAVEQQQDTRAARWLFLGVTFNLAVLSYFKYANFLVTNFAAVTGTNYTLSHIILPLGISFFTFEQIGYLIDIRRGHLYRADILRYALFVSFFPRLVAGPILRYSEILPQLTLTARRRLDVSDLAIGLSIFVIGLCKKTMLADGIAPYANPIFATAASGRPLDLFAAWGGTLAYTFQLYFDFSGYSDMAIGAARCFHIKFPMNFNSPYQATSIIEFWRRWHMTLSRFLRDYLYISLGGNRYGTARRYFNLMLTMLLGGLWHGANWTFIAWGGLHGLYLCVNHGWATIAQQSRSATRFRESRVGRAIGWLLTFAAVVIAWTLFRSPNFVAALDILRGMSGQAGAVLPQGLLPTLRNLQPVLRSFGIHFDAGSGTQLVQTWLWIVALGLVAFMLPNTQQIFCRFDPVLEAVQPPLHRRRLAWMPSAGWAVAIGTVAFASIISITRFSEFLYWQF